MGKMQFKQISVQKFRLLNSLNLDGLKRVNLIAGKNNTGKTSLLEAIFLHTGHFNPELAFRMDLWRGIPGWTKSENDHYSTPWDNLFFKMDNNSEIIIKSTDINNNKSATRISVIKDRNKIYKKYPSTKLTNISGTVSSSTQLDSRILNFNYREKNKIKNYYIEFSGEGVKKVPQIFDVPFQSVFHPSRNIFPPKGDVDRYSKMKLNGDEDILKEGIKIIEDKFGDITISTIGDTPQFYIKLREDKYYPLLISGEGLVKLVSLILEMYDAKGGIYFIDEIENGFHYSILNNVWKIINELSSKYDIQVFATTHSKDTILSGHEYFSSIKEYDFSFFRLQKDVNKINAISYDKNNLNEAIEVDYEVR